VPGVESAPGGIGAATGFTIIQLITVFVMFSLMLLIAIPKLNSAFRQRSVSTGSDRLVLAHTLARSTALRYGRVAQLHIDPTNKSFWVDVDTTGAGQREIIGGVQTVAVPGLTLTATRQLLCFDARGLATTRGGCTGGADTVVFTLSERSSTVIITSLGKVLR
jgi:Tfp pilus assembly protein FimT